MFALIGKLGVVAITLGAALGNCGNPAGTTAHVAAVNATCRSFTYDYDGFSASNNTDIHVTMAEVFPGPTEVLEADFHDKTFTQVSGHVGHANAYPLLAPTGTEITLHAHFTWTDDSGDHAQDYVGYVTC